MDRRLAAILAMDMVGFSRLMEADEEGTLARQKAHLSELINPGADQVQWIKPRCRQTPVRQCVTQVGQGAKVPVQKHKVRARIGAGSCERGTQSTRGACNQYRFSG